MKKIKVCFINFNAHGLFHPSEKVVYGGSESQLYLCAKEIAKDDDFEIIFLTSGESIENRVEIIEKIKLYLLGKHRDIRKKIFGGIFTKIKNKIKLFQAVWKIDADVYVMRAAGIDIGLISLFCRIIGKKFIYMLASNVDVDGSFAKMTHYLDYKLYNLGIKLACQRILQTPYQEKLLKQNFNLNSVLIPNIVPFDNNILPLKEREYVLWIASSQPYKRPELFLKLATNFPQEKFLIIMPLHDKFSDFFEKIKKETEIIHNLKFIPGVPHQQINEYYKRARVFIDTATFWGMNNTVLQSLANGTPVISYQVNPDNFIEKYNLGFWAKQEFDKMVEKTKILIDNQDDWNEKSKNAINYIKKNHNMEKNVNKFKGVIKNLMSRKK